MSLLCSLSAPPGSRRSACQSANLSTGAKLVQLLVLLVLQVHQAILVPQQPPVQAILVPQLQALQVILLLQLQALQVILVHLQAPVPRVTLVPALVRAPPRLLAVMTMAPPPQLLSHHRSHPYPPPLPVTAMGLLSLL